MKIAGAFCAFPKAGDLPVIQNMLETMNMTQGYCYLIGWSLLAASLSAQASVVIIESEVGQDGHIAALIEVPVTLNGIATNNDIFYSHTTFKGLFGPDADALPISWPVKDLDAVNAAINAIATTLNDNNIENIHFTNGVPDDGIGSLNGLVPFLVGEISGCGLCVEARGVHYLSGNWSADESSTFLSLETVTTWAIFPPTPVPEPQSSAMILVGLGLVGWAARTHLKA